MVGGYREGPRGGVGKLLFLEAGLKILFKVLRRSGKIIIIKKPTYNKPSDHGMDNK